MTPENRAAIIAHAREDHPREACGLLVEVGGVEVYRRCRNLGAGMDQFIMDPQDYAAAAVAGEVLAVVHSHPGASPEPSPADRAACNASGVPWYIIAVETSRWYYMEPGKDRPDLIGRSYIYGIQDCWAVVRDWYAEHGVVMPDFTRPEVDDYWKAGDDVFSRSFAEAGFSEVSAASLQRGDMLFFKVAAAVENHCAVYLGDNLIIHHARNRLSCRESYSDFWRKHTTRVLRHANHRSIR